MIQNSMKRLSVKSRRRDINRRIALKCHILVGSSAVERLVKFRSQNSERRRRGFEICIAVTS